MSCVTLKISKMVKLFFLAINTATVTGIQPYMAHLGSSVPDTDTDFLNGLN